MPDKFTIPYYHDYISPQLAKIILGQTEAVPAVPGLQRIPSPLHRNPKNLESNEGLQFMTSLYQQVESKLKRVLDQRAQDRTFIDERVHACSQFNQRFQVDLLNENYQTVIGLQDSTGRTVFGPLGDHYCRAGGSPVAPIPEFLKGPHVTLFGPPDSTKMAINAMNAFHRKLAFEPPIIEKLLNKLDTNPKWGADDEDSKTPLHDDLIDAGINLTDCFDKSIKLDEGEKKYRLAESKLAAPIKRFPGLALPSTFMFFKGNPIPLHIYDFALHFFRNWNNPEALAFYVPKLENEEEAKYLHDLIFSAETLIQQQHPSYQIGSVRLMIVLENPRAILRTHEIMDALYPYFVGASLGWHDYLASTARLFKNDPNYRIPVKADPDIVIKYIKASHSLLADVVGSRQGVKVGGMYGILPLQNDLKSESFQLTLKGFFKDIITQMKRDLTGFWVAHPDFVRIGLAVVSAWQDYRVGERDDLIQLIKAFLSPKHAEDTIKFLEKPDLQGLDKSDPNYVRSLIVADLKESDYIANNNPEEIRYNVFQCLQYLTDWLSGNGCVALPAMLGETAVRVMDDLATTERSRWEVWHELNHGRFKMDEFIKICHEEMTFIRKDQSNEKKIVQVKWDDRTSKWYPIAFKIMLKLMTAEKPCEFATELLMPFTISKIRMAQDPWTSILEIDKEKFKLSDSVERLNYYFEKCGCSRFANQMSDCSIYDENLAKEVIMSFSKDEIIEAASFHGNIGEPKKHLDAQASSEQSLVNESEIKTTAQLNSLGIQYLNKFGFKFLISAKGKDGKQMLSSLQQRLDNSISEEIENARQALWEITQKRIQQDPPDSIAKEISRLLKEQNITGFSLAIANGNSQQSMGFGFKEKQSQSAINSGTFFELASLSKSIAAAFCIEFFKSHGISLDHGVNALLKKYHSEFLLTSSQNTQWADEVTLADLMRHSALNMHYVNGFNLDSRVPTAAELLMNPEKYNYPKLDVINKPGTHFSYSGGGFLVLEYLLELIEKRSLSKITESFLLDLKLSNLTFDHTLEDESCVAKGTFDDGQMVKGGRQIFPGFAAGAIGTAESTLQFLKALETAYHDINAIAPIHHNTAVQMLHGHDLGSFEFMGCKMGLGIFIAEAGENRIAIHQGANEGFRALFFHCYSGPDQGKGFVAFCNSDNRAVGFIAQTAQILIKHLNFSGIDFNRMQQSFDLTGISQEQIVNFGYKKLIFDALLPTLPEANIRPEIEDPLLAQSLLKGARIVQVSNQRFARAENLISSFAPTFDPAHFCAQGKVMDSWESARHNPSGVESILLEPFNSISVNYVYLSTEYHDGNQPEQVSVHGLTLQNVWEEIIPKTQMQGHSFLKIKLPKELGPFKKIEGRMYPDGGFTRLALFKNLSENEAQSFSLLGQANPQRFSHSVPKAMKPLNIPTSRIKQPSKGLKEVRTDWASLINGGKITSASNEHYGPAVQVISPFEPLHMFDGLESARSRRLGHSEEVVIQLGREILISEIILDFKHFVNNNPNFVEIEALGTSAIPVLPKTNVKAFAGNAMRIELSTPVNAKSLRIKTIPDGGINRVHVYSV